MDDFPQQALKQNAENALNQSLNTFKQVLTLLANKTHIDKDEVLKTSKQFLEELEVAQKVFVEFEKNVSVDPSEVQLAQTQVGIQSKISQCHYFEEELKKLQQALEDTMKMEDA